jgi:flotillin
MDFSALLAGWAVPIAVLVLVATAFGLMMMLASNYHTVSPNQVAVVSGRKRQMGEGRVGYRVINGGGFLKYPVLERVDYLFLNVMSFGVEVVNVPCRDGALVTVKAIANVKVKSDEASLGLAVERFLGRQQTEIQNVAKENLESNLRAIVGTLTIEKLIQDRQSLQATVMTEAATDLAKLGLGLDLLNIQDVRDERGYIDALGQTRTAEVKRDAAIGKANAERDALVGSSEADRQGKTARASADQNISHATREKEMIEAENRAKTEAAKARISIASQIATQQETSKLNVETVNAEKARVTAETELQALELQRMDAELRATVIVTAERQKDAKIIAADAEQAAASRIGEALRIKQEKEGQGTQALQTAQAEGRKAIAKANQIELEAQAAGERAKLIAVADGDRARLLAEADGRRALLLAEAEGALKKAEAFKALDEGGRFLLILEASPNAIRAMGEAVGAATKPIADSIGASLASIDEVKIMDFGGANGKGPLRSIGDYPMETITKLVSQAEALGMMPALKALAAKAGVSLPDGPEAQ